MERLSNDQLAALRQLAERATPGPWEVVPDIRPDVVMQNTIWSTLQKGGYEDGGHIGQTTIWRMWDFMFGYFERVIESCKPHLKQGEAHKFIEDLRNKRQAVFEQSKQYNDNDAEFIAAFNPETCLDLLDELEAARECINKPQCEYGDCRDCYGDPGMWCCKCSGALARYRGDKDDHEDQD